VICDGSFGENSLFSNCSFCWPAVQCTVQWDNPAAPLVDVSDFGRTQGDGYGNTETKADQTDDNYSDTSSAVKITQTYTEDNSDLISGKDSNNYSQDTSADIIETKELMK